MIEIFPVDPVPARPLPASVTADVEIIIGILVKCSKGVTVNSQLCQRRPPPPPPSLNVQPRPKVVLETPAPPPPVARPVVRPNLPDFPKMKIKFSTCTTLYVPAKPIYENYKKNAQDAAISLPNSTHLRYKYNSVKK